MLKDALRDGGSIVGEWVPDKRADEVERLERARYDRTVRESQIKFYQSWYARYVHALRNSPVTGPHQR